mmetsp:Transcript_17677/g.32551  ORF Transcript_17677/g.32551 Transcript_17677/m.32551 type:complete len:156 (+) Transcript_17677:32-499(+)
MLSRPATRIEFKAEDAQDYIKSRERQKKQGSSGSMGISQAPLATGPPSPLRDVFSGFPGNGDSASGTWAPPSGGTQAHSRSTAGVSPSSPGSRSPEARPSSGLQLESAPPAAADPSQYQPQVEQLTAIGFSAEQARQALTVTAGDVEAAADWLLT